MSEESKVDLFVFKKSQEADHVLLFDLARVIQRADDGTAVIVNLRNRRMGCPDSEMLCHASLDDIAAVLSEDAIADLYRKSLIGKTMRFDLVPSGCFVMLHQGYFSGYVRSNPGGKWIQHHLHTDEIVTLNGSERVTVCTPPTPEIAQDNNLQSLVSGLTQEEQDAVENLILAMKKEKGSGDED